MKDPTTIVSENQFDTKIEFTGARIVIGPVQVRWPRLKRPYKGKYRATFDIDSKVAAPLQECLADTHKKYLKIRPKSAEMPPAPFGKDLGNGELRFETQNKERPMIGSYSNRYDDQPNIENWDVVRLVVEPVPYSNGSIPQTGVSLRLLGIRIIRKAPSIEDLLYIDELLDEEAGHDDEFDSDWE